MSSITIQVDEALKVRLVEEAERHQRSAEEHARTLLQLALQESKHEVGIGERIRRRFAQIDAPQLQLPQRDQPATLARLGV
jgi:plasmid stability protein